MLTNPGLGPMSEVQLRRFLRLVPDGEECLASDSNHFTTMERISRNPLNRTE
jgi:hypothetical protein